ncbi:MAG: signal peptidase II [Syntrophomonadaceae bacterium]|nr:signal peptidase II [Syntrophomonadaceae bacterium]MDD3023496.1 signal peptidase II [Syntrophomonadaceae bacterium]
MRYWICVLVVFILDRGSKWWVSNHFSLIESQELLDGLLYLTYVENHGAAFGIMPGQSWFFLICGLLVVAGLSFYNARYKIPNIIRISIGVLAGGALGNLFDRYFYGYVIDFLDLRWWPVFNVADMAIVCGGILLLVYLFREERNEASYG